MYEDDQKAKDWLFVPRVYIFRGKTNHLTWKSCSPYFHKLRII